jgi:hypothetical protein
MLVAVFAGHFHSDNRDLYGLPKGPEPLPESDSVTQKTYIAPPLAIKFQEDKQPTARGLLLVDLSFKTGTSHWVVADGNRPPGESEAAIGRPVTIWYDSPLGPKVESRPTGCVRALPILILLGFAVSVVLFVCYACRWRARTMYLTGKQHEDRGRVTG